MPDDPRVQELLDELLDSHATPEDVCGSCVELLPVVRARWRQMCRARAELDALFPPALDPGASRPAALPETAALPAVPGYEVEGVLGLGGMGVVFRARHLRLNRVVALKMALAGAYAGAPERRRFQREAEAVAALRHPNVVQVFDVGDSEGRPYFTMEFMEGGSLAQQRAGTPLPARAAAELAATLAGAVHAAHRAGIVHRDLKPANVLLAADGAPKIGDFGLARRLGGEAALTRTGAAVGTPSYMAPEQARGTPDAAGPAVDVYALGAILYELLTGRPPFRAATGAETVNQLLSEDPVPPSQLNATVPRDLETVCLKCLRKEPGERYPAAAALADDLGRFLRGEAVAARPEGLLKRLVRRVRRRPYLSAAVAVATLSTVALVGGGTWVLSERAAAARSAEAARAAAERAADEDLRDMAGWLRKSSWSEARAALERAKARRGDRAPDGLEQRIAQGERELTLAARLEGVRLERAVSTGDFPDWERSAAGYEAVFREAGLARPYEDVDAVADRIEALHIRAAVADALDDWALCVFPSDRPRHAWLLTVAGRADPDRSDWRVTARAQKQRPAAATTAALAEAGLRAGRCDPLLLGLGRDIAFNAFTDPTPFLARVQRAHPGDLFANLELAERLVWRDRPAEAVRYYQAALAVRPEAPAVCNKLALVLGRLGRTEEAVEYLRRAAAFAPASDEFRRNLVLALVAARRTDEALEQARQALRDVPETARSRAAVWDSVLEVPGSVRLRAALGDALTAAGRESEAVAEYRRALAVVPALREALTPVRELLLRAGRFEELRTVWRAALECRPSGPNAWYGYAELCLFLGREDDYRRVRQALLRDSADSRYPVTAERTGRACLLLPAAGDELLRAVALVDRAASLDRTTAGESFRHFQFAGALADYRRGNFGRAIEVLRGDASGVLGPAPRLVLAMALHRSGRAAEARRTLAAAVLSHDWRENKVRDQDGWIFHVLRREAEGLILPDLPAFLEGKYQPRDNDERLALLGVCQFTNRNRDRVRLYAELFADTPSLASDLNAGHRFNAARAASQVGCGDNAAGLGEPARAQFRKQARDWLRADLALCTQLLDGDVIDARAGVRDKLTRFRDSPDLAGLREPAELEKLSADERKDCLALWTEVGVAIERCEKSGK